MSLSCYIIDDQKYSIDNLSRLVKRTVGLELIGSDTDSLMAVNKLLTGHVKADIVFLDIDMPELDGLKLSEMIGNLAAIVFVTSHPQYALKAFATNAVAYLTKPIDPAAFVKAVEKAKHYRLTIDSQQASQRMAGSIFLKLTPRNVIKLNLDEVVFIKANDKYIDIHLKAAKPLMIKKPLSDMETIMPKEKFIRVHKSHIVNLDYVTSMVGNRIVIADGPVLEIGPSYLEAVYSRFDSV